MAIQRLVALDIDGTLLTYDNKLTDRTRKIVASAAERDDVHVVLATGRVFADTMSVVDRLGFAPEYIIASNGATVAASSPDGTWSWAQISTFNSEASVKAIAAALPEVAIAVGQADPDEHFVCWQNFPSEHIPTRHRFADDLSELFIPAATGIWATPGPDGDREDFHRRTIEAGFGGTSFSIGYTAWLDVSPPGVSKASALDWVRSTLGVRSDQTFAAGDGTNDLAMLRWAALSGAVEGARPEVIAAADITIPSPADDGVAEFLELYVL